MHSHDLIYRSLPSAETLWIWYEYSIYSEIFSYRWHFIVWTKKQLLRTICQGGNNLAYARKNIITASNQPVRRFCASCGLSLLIFMQKITFKIAGIGKEEKKSLNRHFWWKWAFQEKTTPRDFRDSLEIFIIYNSLQTTNRNQTLGYG